MNALSAPAKPGRDEVHPLTKSARRVLRLGLCLFRFHQTQFTP